MTETATEKTFVLPVVSPHVTGRGQSENTGAVVGGQEPGSTTSQVAPGLPRARREDAMSTVSVIIPCYKLGHTVTEAVTSLLTNTRVGLEILVIDDASPDDSWEVVRGLPALDPRITVTRNPQNLGLIGTANAGLARATGDYVVLLSADDAHAPGWLDRAVEQLEAHPRAVLAYGPTRRFTGTLPQLHVARTVRPVLHHGHDWIRQTCARTVTPMLSPEVVVRTSAQRAAGGYRAHLPYTSDMEMWLRLATTGDVLRIGGPVAAFYRVSAQSMSREVYLDFLHELEVRLEAFDTWYAYAEGLVPNRDALMAVARRALAKRALRRAYAAFVQDPVQFDGLCKFALATDQEWATQNLGTLTSLRESQRATQVRDTLLPVTRLTVRARQAMTDVRAVLHLG